ncbi:hypothetical protein AB1Y20_011273 [Prymnesium parvum]|uniref:Microbial-type PARG catalytic domain-containing protein n=1 Tax=Prymnesium parvum TaxID=97485 RepID=A0AB34IM40_PRYPA
MFVSPRRPTSLKDDPSDTHAFGRVLREAQPWWPSGTSSRISILRDTLNALGSPSARRRYHQLAKSNLARWAAAAAPAASPVVEVRCGDWGEVALAATKEYGAMFACLNMANAYTPGGGYVEGSPAQEENMFRRTDCHFSIRRATDLQFGGEASHERYTEEMSALLNAEDGRVYLDTAAPRVCLRGPEDRAAADLGYAWLADEEVFPFLELRAAALDMRTGVTFDADDARRRVRAQFDTLHAAGVRHAVLSAFGCGAFGNPADQVAAIYKEELDRRHGQFDKIIFAIFHPGYGPDNIGAFRRAFEGQEGSDPGPTV